MSATIKSTNVTEIAHQVSAAERETLNRHRGGVVWLTGLSGSGKSTLAMALERRLYERAWRTFVLDGDNVRHRLCRDLGFSPSDRSENIRRVGEVAHLFAEAGLVAITAFISPYRADRDMVRAMGPGLFHEIHVATPLDECERRDSKGLYRKARAGEITEFTGISAPYEEPRAAELVLSTQGCTIEQSVEELLAYVERAFRLG